MVLAGIFLASSCIDQYSPSSIVRPFSPEAILRKYSLDLPSVSALIRAIVA